jgi:hypothetical protein
MLRRNLVRAVLPVLILGRSPTLARADERRRIRVFRDPGCSCCLGWVRHMEQAGFDLRVEERPRTDPARRVSGAPPELTGCHVALYDRFAFEGHVPVAAVRRFLAEPGPWRGLAVPGMPVGSPGMEVDGVPSQTYEIVRFDQAGHYEPYMHAKGAELI